MLQSPDKLLHMDLTGKQRGKLRILTDPDIYALRQFLPDLFQNLVVVAGAKL